MISSLKNSQNDVRAHHAQKCYTKIVTIEDSKALGFVILQEIVLLVGRKTQHCKQVFLIQF